MRDWLDKILLSFYKFVDSMIVYEDYVALKVVGKKKENVNGKYVYSIEAASEDKKYSKFFNVTEGEYEKNKQGELYKEMSVVRSKYETAYHFEDTEDVFKAKLMLFKEYLAYLAILIVLLICLGYIITSFM